MRASNRVDGRIVMNDDKPLLALTIAAPRGFCAGVDRAIRIVELALAKHGAPVHVRHEIVHNRYVVDSLKERGAVFVEDLSEAPDGAVVVFSAHGVPKAVPIEADRRGLERIDATCPLVSKVHRQAERLVEAGRHILFIGHAGHPEVVGTMGQAPPGAMTLIEHEADVHAFAPADPHALAYLTQTTLSVDDTAAIVGAIRSRFPDVATPRGEDICYATFNRQAAVKAMAGECDAILVIGAPHSSNSVRLVEVAEGAGVRATLIERADALDWSFLDGVAKLGITAGASAPECLVRELVERLATRFDIIEREIETVRETVAFKLPHGLEPVA